MFTKMSMTGAGLVVIAIEFFLSAMNVTIEPDSVVSFVNAVITAVGFVWIVWGQLRRKDLSWGFFRK